MGMAIRVIWLTFAEPAPMTENALLPIYWTDLRETSLHAVIGLGVGVGTAALLQLSCGLYFWFEDQQQALGLIALTVALPLGAACGGNSRAALARGLFAGTGLALGACITGGFLPAAISWCAAASLLGAALVGVSSRAAVPASLAWWVLCALPFFFERLGAFGIGDAAREAASIESPWLGFAQHALKADPLHKTFIYFNQLSALSSAAAIEPIDASRLWAWAALAMAAALYRGWQRA